MMPVFSHLNPFSSPLGGALELSFTPQISFIPILLNHIWSFVYSNRVRNTIRQVYSVIKHFFRFFQIKFERCGWVVIGSFNVYLLGKHLSTDLPFTGNLSLSFIMKMTSPITAGYLLHRSLYLHYIYLAGMFKGLCVRG